MDDEKKSITFFFHSPLFFFLNLHISIIPFLSFVFIYI